jgi:hypothetical protein
VRSYFVDILYRRVILYRGYDRQLNTAARCSRHPPPETAFKKKKMSSSSSFSSPPPKKVVKRRNRNPLGVTAHETRNIHISPKASMYLPGGSKSLKPVLSSADRSQIQRGRGIRERESQKPPPKRKRGAERPAAEEIKAMAPPLKKQKSRMEQERARQAIAHLFIHVLGSPPKINSTEWIVFEIMERLSVARSTVKRVIGEIRDCQEKGVEYDAKRKQRTRKFFACLAVISTNVILQPTI